MGAVELGWVGQLEQGVSPVDEDTIASFQTAFEAYGRSLDAAGMLRGADILAPSEMTSSVTVRHGTLEIQDGPFTEAKEMLGGVFVIDSPTSTPRSSGPSSARAPATA